MGKFNGMVWNSSTLATSCEELTHWKRLWCWEGLGAGGEGDDRGWDHWMASLTRWTWVWVNSGSWWWTGRPGVLGFMGSQRVRHDWATELNWTEGKIMVHLLLPLGNFSWPYYAKFCFLLAVTPASFSHPVLRITFMINGFYVCLLHLVPSPWMTGQCSL